MDLESIVRCPRCKGALVLDGVDHRCDACKLRYPTVDGIPRLIAAEAVNLAVDAAARSR